MSVFCRHCRADLMVCHNTRWLFPAPPPQKKHCKTSPPLLPFDRGPRHHCSRVMCQHPAFITPPGYLPVSIPFIFCIDSSPTSAPLLLPATAVEVVDSFVWPPSCLFFLTFICPRWLNLCHPITLEIRAPLPRYQRRLDIPLWKPLNGSGV